MHSGVAAIQKMSQKILKGSPPIVGSMRSQSGTEKHKAAKGTRLKRMAATDGVFTEVASYSKYAAGFQSESDPAARRATISVTDVFAEPAQPRCIPHPV